MTDTQARFILGMPRAGTQAMMRALNADSSVAAFGETLYWGRNWVEPNEHGELDAESIERIASSFDNNHLVPSEGTGSIADDGYALGAKAAEAVRTCTPGMNPGEVFARMCEGVLEYTQRSYWVEKTPHHLQHLDRITRYMPNARFVVMLRSPASFLRSYKHQGDRKDPETRKKFHRLYHPALASLVGRGTYRASINAATRWPDQVLVVRLEELTANPDEWMPRIRSHLHLPADAPATYRQHNSSFENNPNTPTDLTPVETTWLRILLGKESRALDFELPPKRFAPLRMLLSILALFPWMIRNWMFISKHNSSGVLGMIRRWAR